MTTYNERNMDGRLTKTNFTFCSIIFVEHIDVSRGKFYRANDYIATLDDIRPVLFFYRRRMNMITIACRNDDSAMTNVQAFVGERKRNEEMRVLRSAAFIWNW